MRFSIRRSVFVAFAGAVLMTVSAEATERACAQPDPLVSDSYIEVVSSDSIRVREGVDFEIVTSSKGTTGVRILDGETEATPELIYRCMCPDTGCSGTCTVTRNETTNTLTCSGGCYRSSGGCLSCAWLLRSN